MNAIFLKLDNADFDDWENARQIQDDGSVKKIRHAEAIVGACYNSWHCWPYCLVATRTVRVFLSSLLGCWVVGVELRILKITKFWFDVNKFWYEYFLE